MARITFLIGNGFDINVGLKTDYKSFYEYYIKKCPDDILAQHIGKNHEFWSDLELALGKYTEKVKIQDAESFFDSEDNLEQELAGYLENEMSRVRIDEQNEEQTAEVMRRSLEGFVFGLPGTFQSEINEMLYNTLDIITYSFISFNYTNVLDRCAGVTKKALKEIGVHRSEDGSSYSYAIGEILHIHGTVDNEMVLGVNDDEQVANKEFTKNTRYRQCIIKEETNRRYDNGKIAKACEMINTSIVICVFGMSIGQTDKVWWRYLCEWLGSDSNRRLIIYARVGKRKPSKRILFERQDEVLESLRENGDIPQAMWRQIKSQIYIKCNAGIFNFNIVDK